MHARTTDAVVVGAGIAGSAMARSLAAAGLNVSVIDRAKCQNAGAGEFISAASKAMLTRMEIIKAEREACHADASEFVSYWGSAIPSFRNYVFDPHGSALVLDRAKFDRSVVDAALTCGARLSRGTHLASAIRSGDNWELVLADCVDKFSLVKAAVR